MTTSPVARPPRLTLVLLGLLVIIAPAVLTIALVGVYLHSNVLDYVPYSSDEVYNWRQIETFKAAGFDGGYYAHHEQIAAFTFTRFGAWGPIFPMVIGTVARIFGWAFNSAPIYNMVILGAALLILMLLTKPDRGRLLWLLAVISTFWAMLFFVPITMQESLNQGFAIVLAGLFYRLMTKKTGDSRWLKIAIFVLLTFAALIRVSWSFLYLPLFLLAGDLKSNRRIVMRVGIAVALIALMLWLSRGLAAPYPYVLNNILGTFKTSFGDGMLLLWGYIATNLRLLLFGGDGITPLQLLLHYQLIGVVLISILVIVRQRRGRWLSLDRIAEQQPDALVHILNLVPIFLFVQIYFVGYFIHYRHLAMHLLFSLILLVLYKRQRMLAPLVLSNLLFVGVFLGNYEADIPRPQAFHADLEKLQRFQQTAAQVITYDAQADAWCNTALAYNTWDQRFLLLPPEIGYSVILIWDIQQMPPRSKYIVSDPTMEPHLTTLHLQKLAAVDDLTIYRNLDAACP